VTWACAAATPSVAADAVELAIELPEAAGLLEAVELLELLLEEQAASIAAATRAAAGAAMRFHVRVMLNIPPLNGHGS
jgi:predicted secreted protein